MPMFITTAVRGSLAVGQPSTSGGTAAMSMSPVVRPWTMRPATYAAGTGAHAASTDPTTKSTA